MSEEINISAMNCPHCGKRLIYKVYTVSPTEIVRSKRGVLALGAGPLQAATPEMDKFRNRKIITDFINDMGKKGWEYCGAMTYSGLPYNGCLVFRRPIGDEEIKKIEEIAFEKIKQKPLPDSGEKLFNILRRNRENKPQEPVHNIPKPKVPKEEDKIAGHTREEIQALFDEEYNKDKAPIITKEDPEWKKAEDSLMFEALKKEKEEEDTSAIPKTPNKAVKEITTEDLRKLYEDSTKKRAIAFGKETTAYKEWKESYMRNKSLGL